MGSRTRSISALLSGVAAQFGDNKIFLFGLALVLVGLGFKIAAFPFQIWAPDVYQGAPLPVTAFLAVGSKAAGFALLLRVLFIAVPDITARWSNLLIIISGVSILYGNLCAIPQRNLKRLLGYSSIAHAGYLLLGVAALSTAGRSAVLYYLSGYLFTVLSAFTVICLALRHVEGEDVGALAGLHRRSPLSGGDYDPGDGVAGRYPAAGRVLREVPPAQGSHRARPRASRVLLPHLYRPGGRGDFALLLLRRCARYLLVERPTGSFAYRNLQAHSNHPLRLHRRDAIPRLVPNRILEAATHAVQLLR